MKLMTKEIEKKLLKTETGSTLGNMDAEVIVKYFNPCGAGTWLITEGEKLEDAKDLRVPEVPARLRPHQDGTDAGEVACGDVGEDLVADHDGLVPPYRLRIERDLWCKGCTVQDLAA